VGKTAGDSITGSITLNSNPYVLTGMAGKIVGNTADPETSGLYQDYMWTIEFRDEMTNYQSGPIFPDLLFGSVASGYWIPLAYPIPYPGVRTVTFNIVNRITRVLGQIETFTIALLLHGVGDWGEMWPKKPVGGR
jgi:hypothetical protein